VFVQNKGIEVGDSQARRVTRLKQHCNFSHCHLAEFYISEASLKKFEASV
jgi:hypothetical protein